MQFSSCSVGPLSLCLVLLAWDLFFVVPAATSFAFPKDASTRLRIRRSTHLYTIRDSSLKSPPIVQQQQQQQKDTARSFAVKALVPRGKKKTNGGGAFAVDRLECLLQLNQQLSLRDRSFARLLVTTVERRMGQIDAVLERMQDHAVHRPKNLADLYVEAALRVGAAQLLFLKLPPHAAVKETIDVLKQQQETIARDESAAAGTAAPVFIPRPKINYVNAVLRRISVDGPALLDGIGPDANAAPWLVQTLQTTWGNATTNQILESAIVESPRCLTVNVQDIYQQSNQQQGSSKADMIRLRIQEIANLFHNADILPQGSIRIPFPPAGPISSWPMYEDGAWWCQDVSATLPALALYNSLSEHGTVSVSDMLVVDLCAAPGGKTAQLSNYGFGQVTAVEISNKRIPRLQQNQKRLQMDWNVVVADGSEWCPDEELADAVLVDVPCTATGTASKRPDVLRRDPDYRPLLQMQRALAQNAANNIVKVGGILVYATCSLLKEESENQVATLLEQENGARMETFAFKAGEIPGFDEAIDENGWIRVLPGSLSASLGHCDGFFVARLRRVA